jgi:hypothetical protein
MVSLVILARQSLAILCQELRCAGYYVVEASSVFEALWLCTQYHSAVVLVEAEYEDPELGELSRRCTVHMLNAGAYSVEVARALLRP